jgi:hypothetical protein
LTITASDARRRDFFRLVGGAVPVAATLHWFLELRWWWKKQA